MIFLPGTEQQIKFFLNFVNITGKIILIIGPGTIEVARIMDELNPAEIIIIVQEYDSLITMRYELEKSDYKKIKLRMMDFDNTDFKPGSFDIIFTQGSVSLSGRNKIVKEVKKILKSDGIFCAGEIVNLRENPPVFIKDIWHSSDLLPLMNTELAKYYEDRGFEIVEQKDLSFTLKDFYQQSEKILHREMSTLSDEEKSYYKKLLRKISHESNVYLKLGGNTFMGFNVLIMRKEQN